MGRFLVFCALTLDVIAAGLTWLSGAVLFSSFIWHLLSAFDVLEYFIKFHLHALSFLPNIVVPLMPPLFQWDTWHISWGFLWLGVYLFARVFYVWKSLRGSWHAPTNVVHIGEPRWNALAACIELYQHQLTRFSPVPIRLSVPKTFRYTEAKQDSVILWQRNVPIIPPGLLSPTRQPLLCPLLAIELAKYNSGDLTLRTIMSTYPDSWPDVFLGLFLVWLWLPTLIKHTIWWKRWCFRSELAYDTFASFCGQGEALLSILKTQKQHGFQTMPTSYEPSTEERVGHLMGLLNQEYKQMRKIDLATPTTFPGPLPKEIARFLLPHQIIRRRLLQRKIE